MKDVWQSYAEDESKGHRLEQAIPQDFQSFTLIKPRMTPLIIGTIATIGSLLLIKSLGITSETIFGMLMCFLLGMNVIIQFIFLFYFKQVQIVGLYDDKIVINGRNTETLLLSDISGYNETSGRSLTSLTFRLNNGQEKKFTAESGIGEFIEAFEDKIIEKDLLINKYEKDYSIALIIVSVLCVALFVFLIWCIFFRHVQLKS